jgi:hypothetical protein
MFYRRVTWADGAHDYLEKYLRDAHKQLSTTRQRTFTHGDGELQGLAWGAKQSGLCVHIASYVPHQPASLVPSPSKAESRDTSQKPPPPEYSFLEGDIFFVLSGNHLVLCPSGANESVALLYINYVLREVGEDKLITRFSVESVADIDKIKLLQSEGVKKIALNASLYEATMSYMERTTTKTTLLGGIAKDIAALFAEDKNYKLREIGELENLSVKLEISFDARKRGGEVGRERLEAAASRLLDEETGGFTIVTGNDNRLTADEICVNKKVSLPVHGNSVSRDEAWSSLAEYLKDLKASGTL